MIWYENLKSKVAKEVFLVFACSKESADIIYGKGKAGCLLSSFED